MVTRARLKDDGTVVEGRRDGSERPLVQDVDRARIDATTEAEIAAQIAADEADAMRDAAAYPRRFDRCRHEAPAERDVGSAGAPQLVRCHLD